MIDYKYIINTIKKIAPQVKILPPEGAIAVSK